MLKYLLAATLLVAGPAWAGSGTASPKPPAPPKVDLSGLPASADVQPKNPDGEDHPVRARLLFEKPTVAAGETVRVGLLLNQQDEWHTYWKSPGDIGLPTDITWSLPSGASITPHEYPIPQRFEQDGMVSYGYEDQVLLISELTIPAGLAPGQHEIGAEASWLVCKTSCIPGNASAKLQIDVVPAGTSTAVGPAAPLFDHFAAQHPVDPTSVAGVGFDMTLSQSAIRPNETFRAAFLITGTGAELAPAGKDRWPTFTPIAGVDWMVNEVAIKDTPQGVLVVIDAETFEPDPLPTSDRIGGLVQVKVDGEWVRTEVTMGLPWAATGATVQDNSGSPLFQLAGTTGTPSGGGGEVLGNGLSVAAPFAAVAPAVQLTPVSLLLNLGLAFLGGLLLNVMPCVLPVITLKLYSLVEQIDITASEQRTAGAAYTGGIVASFWALAATIVVLRVVFGIEVDWGFQFQYPPYVAALATVVFAFGLSLFGVFEIPAFGVNQASEASSKEGPLGYFFTGVFATLLATPCSAPFLGPAIAYAFAAPTIVLVGIFTSVALGLAAPFLLVAFVPAAYRLLPKPGAWMEGFKQLLGFTLIATTIWLVDVLIAQIGADRAVGFMGFLVFVAIGCWAFGRYGGLGASGREQVTALFGGVAIATVGGILFLDLQMAEAAECDTGEVRTDLAFDEEIPWQPFNEERIAALVGQPVFIDFTADWCLTCKVNERTILETAPVRAAMAEHGIVPLKADWTRRDATITEWLRRHGRAGVPFYLVLPADPTSAPISLPEVITKDMVIEALAKAP